MVLSYGRFILGDRGTLIHHQQPSPNPIAKTFSYYADQTSKLLVAVKEIDELRGYWIGLDWNLWPTISECIIDNQLIRRNAVFSELPNNIDMCGHGN